MLILQVRLENVVATINNIEFPFAVLGIMMWDAGNAKQNNNYGQQIRNTCLT